MYWLRLTLKPTETPPTRPTMYWLHHQHKQRRSDQLCIHCNTNTSNARGKPPIPPKKQILLLRLDTCYDRLWLTLRTHSPSGRPTMCLLHLRANKCHETMYLLRNSFDLSSKEKMKPIKRLFNEWPKERMKPLWWGGIWNRCAQDVQFVFCAPLVRFVF